MVHLTALDTLKYNNIDIDNLNQDLIAYSENGLKAVAIYDEGRKSLTKFHIIYLKKQKNEWAEDAFAWVADKVETYIDDPIYIMNECSYFLSF